MNYLLKLKRFVPIIYIFIGLAILNSCKSKNNQFVVSGIIHNASNELIYLSELTKDKIIHLDSVNIDNDGQFILHGKTDLPGFFIIEMAYDNYVTIVCHPGDIIDIETNASNLSENYKISGSEDSRLIKELTKKINKSILEIDSLGKAYNNYITSPNIPKLKKELDSTYIAIKRNLKNYVYQFINTNQNSIASIMALYAKFTPHENVLNPINDFNYFLKVDSVLHKKYPLSKPVILLHNHVNDLKKQKRIEGLIHANIQLGAKVPEIKLPDSNGDSVSLSSLQGKYVLLDFWASWCDECRTAHLIMAEAYQKYKTKGFEIFQVSLDKSRDQWLNAIKKDNLTWINVSDLGYWNSSVVELYNLQGIPNNYLLDEEGRVIAKNLKGERLINKLNEIIKY